MLHLLQASVLVRLHDSYLSAPGWPSSPPGARHDEKRSDVWTWVEINHACNALLWNEEDQARRTDVGDGAIAACKRLIDRYNQCRNDAVEAIDELLLGMLPVPRADARLSSETAGAMIDRLSILALKIRHMRAQTGRLEAGTQHVVTCDAKLRRLIAQREDLGRCLDRLLDEARQGRGTFKVYRQFKMYNDPTLNPWLYGRAAPAEGGRG
jgi:hypothetical protein